MLQLSVKLADEHIEKPVEIKELFQGDSAEIIKKLTRLEHEEILNFLPEIRAYVKDPGMDPFIKTVLLNVMKEKDINEEVEVVKFNKRIHFHVTDYYRYKTLRSRPA